MTLGNKIQELRKKQSLSQEAFADIMGVTRQSVSKWELDQSYPAIDKLVEMADFFNVSLDEMLRNETNPSSITANIVQDINKDMDDINKDKDDVNKDKNDIKYKNNNSKELLWYFFWWAVMAIIIMILFGIKEYFAGFIVSQIFVWATVIIKIYSYIKRRSTVSYK